MKIKRLLIFLLTGLLTTEISARDREKEVRLSDRPLPVWKTVMKEGESAAEFTQEKKIIRLSGKFGYIRTQESFSDYRLFVEWRWVGEPTNSGIFVHLTEDKIWPACYECQLMAGRAGDLVNSGGTTSNERKINITNKVKKDHVVPRTGPSNEKPAGEWNRAEILCEGNNMLVYINGELQNKLTGLSSTRGAIGLQSEGGGIEFRNVVLIPLQYDDL